MTHVFATNTDSHDYARDTRAARMMHFVLHRVTMGLLKIALKLDPRTAIVANVTVDSNAKYAMHFHGVKAYVSDVVFNIGGRPEQTANPPLPSLYGETKGDSTYRIHVSLYYNYKGGSGSPGPDNHDLAIKGAPKLGYCPHAQDVMRYFGINYAEAIPCSITDSWSFTGCDRYPAEIPRWMTVVDEATGERVAQ